MIISIFFLIEMKYYDIGLISIYYFRIAINFSYVRMIPKLYPKLE